MFEDMTYEKLLQTCMDKAPEGIDTRQGSIFYDACAAKCLLLAEIYADLDTVSDGCHMYSAVGDELDSCALDHGIVRNGAISFKCRGVFVGTTPPTGSRFFAEGIFFTLKDNLNEIYPDDSALLSEGNLYLEAEVAGTSANLVKEGTILTPYNDIEGLESAKVGKIIIAGAEEEDDDSLRERLRNKVGGPSENGNKHHYKTWCEECTGVGCARIFPLAKIVNGNISTSVPNWVTGVLLTDEGKAVEDSTVETVQEYIDPDMLGLGEGVANLGAHFMAVKAPELLLDISVEVELGSATYSLSDVKAEIETAIIAYLKDLALSEITFTNGVPDNIIIRIKQIGSIISRSSKIADYDNLKIRIGTGNYVEDNISVAAHNVVVLHNVSVSEITT